MNKYIELVGLPSGEVVAVGAFHNQDRAQTFAEWINSYDGPKEVTGTGGGVRMMTVDALARELEIPVAKLWPPKPPKR